MKYPFIGILNKKICLHWLAVMQGRRQTLIENGNLYLLEHVPVATNLQNTSVESRKFVMDGNNLKGHVVQSWKGENKEWLLSEGSKGMYSKYMDTKKSGEVSKNTDSEEFLQDKASTLSTTYYNGYWMKAAKSEYDNIEEMEKKKAKQANINFKELSGEEKAAQLYYTIRFTKMLNFTIDDLADKINVGEGYYNGLAFPLFCTLKAAGLQPAIMVSNRRISTRMSELMDAADLTTTAYLPGSSKAKTSL